MEGNARQKAPKAARSGQQRRATTAAKRTDEQKTTTQRHGRWSTRQRAQGGGVLPAWIATNNKETVGLDNTEPGNKDEGSESERREKRGHTRRSEATWAAREGTTRRQATPRGTTPRAQGATTPPEPRESHDNRDCAHDAIR
jgi:hypothetical protein